MRWIPAQVVNGVPCDMTILGYNVNTANTLRLWKAEARESFSFQEFNVGDYYGAVHDKVVTENITKVLYPNDQPIQGKQLRLEQQYFFVSCSLQDMIRIHLRRRNSLNDFHETFAVQLNDTHPSIGVAELMRLLVDEHQMPWDTAWEITEKTFAYTNHTLLPEALEKWPVSLFGSLLPRHLEIIYEINRRFLDQVRLKFGDDPSRIARMSLIDEGGERYVRMAYLATVGSHKVNGVAELHSQLLKETTLHDFFELWPEKFINITNGVTPRRFVVSNNPRLASLVTRKIGGGWIKRLDDLRQLEGLVEDAGFRSEFQEGKQANKQDLADCIHAQTGKPLCDALGLEMQLRPGLEEIHYGKWEDKTVDFVKQHYWDDYIHWLAEPAWNPPTGGETSVEIASRALLVIAEIQEKYKTGNVLVVSHKATIRILLCDLLGIDLGISRSHRYAGWLRDGG